MARKGASAIQVWSQVPVASRTVEVNTKTGFSLTAGSYVVRASSTQSGYASLSGVAQATATISSVTTTRTHYSYAGGQFDQDPNAQSFVRLTLTNATTITGDKSSSTGSGTGQFSVVELF